MPNQTWQPVPGDIVDAHHHLWDLTAVDYPWLTAKGVTRFFGDPTPIQKNYLVEDFRRDFGNVPIAQSVHIQVGAAKGSNLAEANWLQQQHEQYGLPSAFVAYCDLEQTTRTGELDQLQELSAFRGIRQIVGRHPGEDTATGTGALLNDSNWLDGLKELETRGLSFDLQLIPDQMERVAELLSHVPDLRVAVCHCGSPWYRDTQGFALWSNGLKQLAALPNVYCKISGLGMFDHDWTVDSLKPVFDAVVDTFGASRCMLGSNFPVDKLYAPYQHLWHSYNVLGSHLSDDDKQQLFGKTCKYFYRLNAQEYDH